MSNFKPLIIDVERRWKKDAYTIGVLSIDGVRICNTLEDTVRDIEHDGKIPGRTAIPEGEYVISMNVESPKFKNKSWARPYNGIVPRLLAVPHFSGVLIHPGNTAADTDGCILVGNNRAKGAVLDSQATYTRLMDEYLMPAKYNEREIYIRIHG